MKRKKWTQAEIKRNDELKAAGREAFRQGQPVESCPYESAFNQDRWSWIWGWHDEARAKKDAEEKEAAFLAEAARRGYIKPAPQAQEETRGAPAPAFADRLMAVGYAPGGYSILCQRCRKMSNGCDKRAITCHPCAVAMVNVPAPASPDGDWEQVYTLAVQAADELMRHDARGLVVMIRDIAAQHLPEPSSAPAAPEAGAPGTQTPNQGEKA